MQSVRLRATGFSAAAPHIYKDNLQVMRVKLIPFALAAGCEIFAGAETLVRRSKDAFLIEKLCPIWEHTEVKN